MPLVTIPADTWTVVHTTTSDIAIENKGGANIYLNTGTTTGLPVSEGILLEPNFPIKVGPGLTVSVGSPKKAGLVFYTTI